MNAETRKKYGGIIGLLLMLDWLLALMYCFESRFEYLKYAGYILVTASFVAMYLYTASLEEELNQKDRKQVNGFYEN
jgi:multisubunit Na+/H+ antiporter MnhG subunit